LVKLSGEALGGSSGIGVDGTAVANIGHEITLAHDQAEGLAVVVGGGNFFRGARSALWSLDRVTGDHVGMLATVMNGLLLHDWLQGSGVRVSVFSALPVSGVIQPYNPHQVREDLAQGILVILAGGTGNPYFTTDTTACIRGLEIGATAVIKATRVDGVFDRDPEADSSAMRYDRVTFDTAMQKGLAIMDSTAFAICRDNKLEIRVLNIAKPGNLARAVQGEPVGTLVSWEEETK
jgi:uridylate kinase